MPTGRGISNTEIRIGVLADPGNTVAPGLEQEFFDAADGFSKWCNAAGGINGRKIVIDKWDAKLFNVGQAVTSACQKDFMLVGGGNAIDDAGREAAAGLQARADPRLRRLGGGGERRAAGQGGARPTRPSSATARCGC